MNLFTRTFSKIFKSSNQQELDRIQNIVEAINNKENEFKSLTEGDFKEKTINFQKNALLQAEEILTDIGLKDRLYHFPNQLSGGEQQRVAIARAIINKPELILADEPTGNLDEENSQVIADLLFNVSQKYQKSLCLVTHDLELANKCDRLMKIDNGTII